MTQFHASKSHLPFAIGVPAIVWQVLFFYIPLGFIAISSFLQFSEIGSLVTIHQENSQPNGCKPKQRIVTHVNQF